MDELDDFLNSLEVSPIESIPVSHTVSGATLDTELEALFHDFNSIIGTRNLTDENNNDLTHHVPDSLKHIESMCVSLPESNIANHLLKDSSSSYISANAVTSDSALEHAAANIYVHSVNEDHIQSLLSNGQISPEDYQAANAINSFDQTFPQTCETFEKDLDARKLGCGELQDISCKVMDTIDGTVPFELPDPPNFNIDNIQIKAECEVTSALDSKFVTYLQDVSNGCIPVLEMPRVRYNIFRRGYLPPQFRTGVYLYLLDKNSNNLNPAFTDENLRTLVKDAAKDISAHILELIEADSNAAVLQADCTPSMASMMQDILIFFCVQKRIDYHPLFAFILCPLLCNDSSPTLCSTYSLFYRLVTDFIPILDIPSTPPHCVRNPCTSISAAINGAHQLLRLLLGYHNPLLMHHLDRTVPGWEQPMVWEFGGKKRLVLSVADLLHCTRRMTLNDNVNNAEINDDLSLSRSPLISSEEEEAVDRAAREVNVNHEFRMGYASLKTQLLNKSGTFDRNNNGNDISSAHPSKGKPCVFGQIPMQFICSVFSASMPSKYALELLDWAILAGERFAGVYLTAALLHIFSVFLRNMTGIEIREWISEVAEGRGLWYKSPLLPKYHFFPNDNKIIQEHAYQQRLSWATFISGWMYATSAMRRQTPFSFRDALAETDLDWAQEVARRAREANINNDVDPLVPPISLPSRQSVDVRAGIDSGYNAFDFNRILNSSFRLATTNYYNFSHETVSRSGSSSSGKQALSSATQYRYFPHDRYIGGHSVSVWVRGEEVIPCFLSKNLGDLIGRKNSNEPLASIPNLEAQYVNGVLACTPNSEFHHRLTPVDGYSIVDRMHEAPFYLCLDCRTVEERAATGLIPNAIVIGANFMHDPSMIADVLTMLEPLADSAHLCIMGSGEAYVRYTHCKKLLCVPDKRQINCADTTSGRAGRLLQLARNFTDAQSSENVDKKDVAPSGVSCSEHENIGDRIRRDDPSLCESIAEYRLQLSMMAMFFMKKSFRRISIIEGGFCSMLLFLTKQIERSLFSQDGSIFSAIDDNTRWQMVSDQLSELLKNENRSELRRLLMSLYDFEKEDNVIMQQSAIFESRTPANGRVDVKNKPNVDTGSKLNSADIKGAISAISSTTIQKSLSTLSSVGVSMSTGLSKLGGHMKKRFSIFSGNDDAANAVSATLPAAAQDVKQNTSGLLSARQDSNVKLDFVIDDEEDDPQIGSSLGYTLTAEARIAATAVYMAPISDAEKAEALATHRLNGLKYGDAVTVSKQDLPGTVLFHAEKYRLNDTLDFAESNVLESEPLFLVISRERFIVLQICAGSTISVGASATVVSNDHLTQLLRIAFRKRDPNLVSLHFKSDGIDLNDSGADANVQRDPNKECIRRFRVSKHAELVAVLQKNMQRFK